MAQRFGGKYSPDGTNESESAPRGAYHNARVTPAGARSNVLFVPPVVLIATSLTGGAVTLGLGLVAAGTLALGAWLLRSGLEAESAFHDRKIARRPAIPRKILAAALAGGGVAIAAFRNDPGIVAPLIYGAAAAGLHIAAFGIDPLKSKGMEGIDTFQQDRVARVVDDAEAYLAEMRDAVLRAGDRQVEARVERFQTSVRDMLRTVEEDPRDLTAARKYLGVYLMGARDASSKFADVYSRTRNTAARSDYMMLLTDLEENFIAKTEKMLDDSNTDLAIEIDVLRDRLQREGVRPD